jgi:hypothetical protein
MDKMERKDFIAVIGFNGPQAVVDKKLQKKIQKLSTLELFKEGHFKPAFCSALHKMEKENDDSDMRSLLPELAKAFSLEEDAEVFKRVFGVFSIPGASIKILYV